MTQPLVPTGRRPANDGPKAAARNREALIAAAREIFASQGLYAPLSSIARRAGVGQGVLYRHFPDRDSVAIAVLEENVRQVEEAAAAEGALLADVLGVLTWHLTDSAAFLGLLHSNGAAGHAATLAHARVLSARVEAALRRTLPARHRLGGGDDLMIAVGMVSGATSGPARESRERRAAAAWRLLGVEVGPVRPFGGRHPTAERG
ncbi:TetR family transcriptional regulator [Streptomyces sp. NPDC059166]|uniref:TetR family transcriptional regulator n=1 Tax=Streptomyces sp. NPDC059166 TaxID=3346752 RepID=UPI0036D091C1